MLFLGGATTLVSLGLWVPWTWDFSAKPWKVQGTPGGADDPRYSRDFPSLPYMCVSYDEIQLPCGCHHFWYVDVHPSISTVGGTWHFQQNT